MQDLTLGARVQSCTRCWVVLVEVLQCRVEDLGLRPDNPHDQVLLDALLGLVVVVAEERSQDSSLQQ